ncbi:MAG: hypothetical protein RR707_14475, partial [Comamonas sp.]
DKAVRRIMFVFCMDLFQICMTSIVRKAAKTFGADPAHSRAISAHVRFKSSIPLNGPIETRAGLLPNTTQYTEKVSACALNGNSCPEST